MNTPMRKHVNHIQLANKRTVSVQVIETFRARGLPESLLPSLSDEESEQLMKEVAYIAAELNDIDPTNALMAKSIWRN